MTITTTALSLKERIIEMLRSIYDPEIPVNIYDLGLIYDVEIESGPYIESEPHTESEPQNCIPINRVRVKMTLTSPACPVAQTFPGTVEEKLLTVKDVNSVLVELVWDPPWTKDNMSDAAKLQLNML